MKVGELQTQEHPMGVAVCIPVRGMQSAAEPSYNGAWAASYGLHTFSAGAPHNWCTAGDENIRLHFLTSISWNSNVFCPELATEGSRLNRVHKTT
jgi:hypothetical protein